MLPKKEVFTASFHCIDNSCARLEKAQVSANHSKVQTGEQATVGQASMEGLSAAKGTLFAFKHCFGCMLQASLSQTHSKPVALKTKVVLPTG